MKNLVKIFSVLMMIVGTFAFGQEKYQKINFKEAQNVEGVLIKIPKELQFSGKDKSNLTTYKVYDKNINDFIYLTADDSDKNNIKFYEIKVPVDSKYAFIQAGSGCPDGYRSCARACTDKPTTAGVILCTGYCIIDCSGN